jgi:hypothetical protein
MFYAPKLKHIGILLVPVLLSKIYMHPIWLKTGILAIAKQVSVFFLLSTWR